MCSCAEDETLGRFFLEEIDSIILKPISHDVIIKYCKTKVTSCTSSERKPVLY
jgi:hypothetical protein